MSDVANILKSVVCVDVAEKIQDICVIQSNYSNVLKDIPESAKELFERKENDAKTRMFNGKGGSKEYFGWVEMIYPSEAMTGEEYKKRMDDCENALRRM